MAQTVKSLSKMQDREDLLEKKMATHSSILAWEIPWAEDPGGATVHGATKCWPQLSD